MVAEMTVVMMPMTTLTGTKGLYLVGATSEGTAVAAVGMRAPKQQIPRTITLTMARRTSLYLILILSGLT